MEILTYISAYNELFILVWIFIVSFSTVIVIVQNAKAIRIRIREVIGSYATVSLIVSTLLMAMMFVFDYYA